MSYTPTTWAAGDTVTAAKLNKLEQGVASGGGVLVVNMSHSEDIETITADKTASEMWSAAQGGIILAKSVFPGMTRIELVTTAEYSDEMGYIFAVGSNYSLYASAGTDYPSSSNQNSGGAS